MAGLVLGKVYILGLELCPGFRVGIRVKVSFHVSQRQSINKETPLMACLETPSCIRRLCALSRQPTCTLATAFSLGLTKRWRDRLPDRRHSLPGEPAGNYLQSVCQTYHCTRCCAMPTDDWPMVATHLWVWWSTLVFIQQKEVLLLLDRASLCGITLWAQLMHLLLLDRTSNCWIC